MRTKHLLIPLSIMCLALSLSSCGDSKISDSNDDTPSDTTEEPKDTTDDGTNDKIDDSQDFKEETLDLTTQGAGGYISSDLGDFSIYVGTSSYVEVSTPTELFNALINARSEYSASITQRLTKNYVVRKNVRKNETNWTRAITKGLYLKNDDGTYSKISSDTPFSDTSYTASMTYYEDSPYDEVEYTQTLTKSGNIHVIEIKNDLNLGYFKLTDDDKKLSIVNNFTKSQNEKAYAMSSMYTQNGMTQVAIERTNDLLIYSKNGSKITHGGFKISYSKNIAIRNLSFDEMWQWEDGSTTASKVGDYDAHGWAYLKIAFADNIWIDHCTFGKSYDGQIDISNPTYNTDGTYTSAPYQASGNSAVHISWCSFTAGDDSEDGYIYKMMQEIESSYQASENKYMYYKKLRDEGLSFDDILYGIAIPQKKAFLDGDSGDEYKYNLNLTVSIAYCYFKNIEDRLPKVRGGNAYMYNCLIDNFDYIEYRDKLKNLNVQSKLQTVNSSWKCGLVSQGIVCGNGGSVMAENTIFRGIDSLLKNNDSSLTNNSNYEGATINGGYKLVGCTYQRTKTSDIITDVANMPNSTPSTLKEEYFKWNTKTGEAPFTPTLYSIEELEEILLSSVYASGVNTKLNDKLLNVKY